MKNIIIFYLFIFSFFFSFTDELSDIFNKYFKKNDWENAKNYLLNYIQNNGDNTLAYQYLGIVENELKNYDSAILNLKKSIQLNNNDEKKGELYYNIAHIYYSRKMIDASIENLNKSISLNPLIYENYYLLGLIYFEKNDYQNALNFWNKCLTNLPAGEKKNNLKKVVDILYRNIENERLKKEMEERRKQELLDLLKQQLEDKKDETNSLEEYKIKKETKKEEEFELID